MFDIKDENLTPKYTESQSGESRTAVKQSCLAYVTPPLFRWAEFPFEKGQTNDPFNTYPGGKRNPDTWT